MTDKIYTYNINTDFPNGLNLDNLAREIQSSDITRALRGIDSNSTDVSIIFTGEEDLTESNLNILQGDNYPTTGGILLAHNSTPPIDIKTVSVEGMSFASDGRQATYSSPRPIGDYSTYFTGAGDDQSVGDGNKLLINMTDDDITKYVEISFNEEILVKDGFIVFRNAPFGSTVSASVHHPTYGKIGGFVNRAPMIGSTFIHFNTDDYGTMPLGTKMRITVENSNGTNGEDPAGNFVVAARIEMFRINTV